MPISYVTSRGTHGSPLCCKNVYALALWLIGFAEGTEPNFADVHRCRQVAG